LKEILVGGSTFPKSLIAGFEKDFNIKGVQAWGMTETSPLGTLSRLLPKHETLPLDKQMAIRAKQGVPMPGVEIRIVDAETDNVLPHNGEAMGELQIKGAWIVNSYFKGENSDKFTDDGSFKTGDISTIDKDCYMEIKDRTKDLIKSGGEWISSVDLETALISHPKIKEAAVIAIPDKKWIEGPLATVVLIDNDDNITKEELMKFLAKNGFAKYQIPTEYVYLSEVPKTSVGKFNKKEIRRLYSEGKLG
jgi:fatty-acyl-CoA synthase